MVRLLFFLCAFGFLAEGKTLSLKPPVQQIALPPKPCPVRGVLSSAFPCSGCGSIFFSVSGLLWQAKLWGLEFAAKSFVPNVPGSSIQTFDQKLFVPDFAWKPGLKLAFGSHLFNDDQWDFQVLWTYYREGLTHLKKRFDSVIQPDGIGIIPLWHYPFLQTLGGNTGSPLRYGAASGNWTMTFNTFDLDLGRFFFPQQPLPMHLKIGAKIASIRQKAQADYGNGTTVQAIEPQGGAPGLFQFVSSHFEVKTRQWGLGPRMGLESKWNFWRGFNLISNGAFSILCSFFDITTEYEDVIAPSPGQSKMKMKEHFRELTPVCEAMLGLDWGMCFSENLFLGISAGYEWQYWWAVNHARRHYVQTLPGETFDMRGELQMQGLNAAIKFDF